MRPFSETVWKKPLNELKSAMVQCVFNEWRMFFTDSLNFNGRLAA